MRGLTNLTTGAIVGVAFLVGGIASGCAPEPPQRSAEVVPKDLVLPGYEQKDCWFERRQDQEDSGGNGPEGNSSGAMVTAKANRSDGSGRPAVRCHHLRTSHEEICIDDNHVEHPMQWCKDREAEKNKPNSGEPHTLCGAHDGVLRSCEEGGQ